MIKILQNRSIVNDFIDDSSIIFVSPCDVIKYKLKYLNKNILITTINNYANKMLNKYSNYKLATKEVTLLLMDKAFLEVKDDLKLYNKVDHISFVKELVKTYDKYYNYKLIGNQKTDDINIIFKEYELLLNKNNYVSNNQMIEFLINNIDKIETQNIYFENFTTISYKELEFINKIGSSKNVVLYANTLNNDTLIKKLNLNKDNNLEFKDVTKVCTNDLYEEVLYIKQDIINCINNGIKYKDILIVSNVINDYRPYFKQLFNFPYHEKIEKGNLTKSFIELFGKLLNGDFSCQNIMLLLKLNIFKYSKKQINLLDNYIYTWDLENTNFYNEFLYNPSGDKLFNDNDINILKELNELRLSIIMPIKYLISNVIENNDTTDVLKYLYMFLDEEEVSNKLFEKDEAGYNLLISNLELINDLFNESNIYNIMDLLSLITNVAYDNTSYIDEVNVCDINDYSDNEYKKIYFIGATDKNIPSTFKFNDLINSNDVDKETLLLMINEYKDKELNVISNILLKNNITITYHKLNDENINTNISIFVKELKGDTIYFKYSLPKENKKMLKNKISENTAIKLYKDNIILSPSSIETYAKCKYSFFCNYGLRLNIKEKQLFDNRKVGTYIHFLLENIIRSGNINNLKDDINKYTNAFFDINNIKVNNTLNYVINKLKDSTYIIINNILKELDNSMFKPLYTEFKINDNPIKIQLNNSVITIKGIIDRVDSYEDNDNFYYRIIDYKTGIKKFRLDDVLEGLNLQMLIYLLAIKNSNISSKNIVPTGFLYCPALVKENKDELNKNLLMNGIVNKDNIKLYGNNIGDFIDIISKDKIKEDKVLNTKDLQKVFNEVIKVIKKLGNDIYLGDIEVNPINNSRCNSCDYCKFNSICKFNKDEDKYRNIKNYTNSEVISMIEGDTNGMD